MKTKMIILAMSALAVMALAGCGQQSINNPPASENAAGGQPMPGAETTNDVMPPPTDTNSVGTNNPTAAK